MIYSWPLEVVLRDGTRLIGDYETEDANSQDVIYDLLYESEEVFRAFFSFTNTRKREIYIVSPDEVAALILGMPPNY